MELLLIDDEASLRRTLRITLESMGHQVAEAGDRARALDQLGQRPFDVAFLDLRLGREQGLDLIPAMLQAAPGLHLVIITAYATVETAVEAMKRGAFDYLPKPFTPDQLRAVLQRWAQVSGLRRKVAALEEDVRAAAPEEELATEEPVMRQALELAFKVASSEATVLPARKPNHPSSSTAPTKRWFSRPASGASAASCTAAPALCWTVRVALSAASRTSWSIRRAVSPWSIATSIPRE